MPDFHFDDSEAVEQVLLPVGWYEFTVEKVEPKESSTGKPMLFVLFCVAEGDHEGAPFFQNFMLAGKAAGITKAFLRAATGDASGGMRSTSDLEGCRVRARLIQKVWSADDGGDGELQNRAVKWQPTDSDPYE